jgi:nucleoid-associated protein YgaU/phage baseplate assembly protein W
MATLNALGGYNGQIWQQVLSVLDYAENNLSPTASPSTQQIFVASICQTFRDARDCFDAYLYATAWAQEYELLAPILTFNLGLSAGNLSFVTNRIDAFQAAANAVSLIYPTSFNSTSGLITGVPVIPSPSLIEFLMQWNFETPSAALLASSPTNYPAQFASDAQAQATAWQNCVAALAANGVGTGSTYDAAQRQASVSQESATAALAITVSTASNPTTTWNLLISMTCLCRIGSVYAADPTTEGGQQLNIARYVTMQSADTFNTLLVQLRQYIPEAVLTTILRNGDTLVSLAARELGNFELWPQIAALNGLIPPYILPLGSAPMAGFAVPGQQIFLPSTTSTITQPIGTQVPTYENNYLGVDFYLGPLSQVDMNVWTGDFNLISGYNNLSTALTRRILTTLGMLIFHPQYGSRIPPEVGAVLTSTVAGYLNAYAQSAILTDPRVNQVSAISTTVNSPNGAIQITATAIPNGAGSSSVTLNEVLEPA